MATIMLIDDDIDLVEMNSIVLTHRGHQVRPAYSAREAGAMLESQPADLAVVDVMMESVSAGFELIRQMRRKHPTMPILVLTGVHKAMDLQFKYAPDEDWLPAVKVLEKPLDPARLADEIEAVLAAKQALGEGR